jgi:hypothetical protein
MVLHFDDSILLVEAYRHALTAEITVGWEKLLLKRFIPNFYEPGFVAWEVVVWHKIAQVFEEQANVFIFKVGEIIWQAFLEEIEYVA